ncbi:efflux RND transporter periplasmic adaptor subunit [Zavarzinia sp.]|uniref:efflux RND transporter periplasmic adaptor subunit n=1 Tax=Zavarzinia sp. TaxID=2027920 RepID=UPI0035699A9F
MRHFRPLPIAALACALLLAVPGWAADYVVAAKERPDTKSVFAMVESRTVVPARARIGGTIREVSVVEGSAVEKDQVLALVVDDKLALQMAAAAANIAALKNQYDNAKIELDRARELRAKGIAPQSRVDQAKTQYDVFANQMTAAEAEKSVIDQQAKEGAVLAPAAGRVLTVPVTPGSVILPGETVARIATGPYFLRLSLPERHAGQLTEGATVEVIGRVSPTGEAMSGGGTRLGKIARVYPEITDGKVTADVEIDDLGTYFVNERLLVTIPVGQRRVIAVPAAAVTSRHGMDYVKVGTADGTAEVAVIPGATFTENGTAMVEILSGLADGDRVQTP